MLEADEAEGLAQRDDDPGRVARLPPLDRRHLAEQVAHLVGAFQQHHPGERVDVEREVLVAREMDDLCIQVDRQLGVRVGRDQLEELAMLLGLDDDRQQAVLQGVVPEDVRERGRQDRPDAPSRERPRCVLARRARSEIVAHEEDLPVDHGDAIHDEQGLLESAVLVVSPVTEERVAEAVLVGDLQVSGGDDLVGVDVVRLQGDDGAGECPDWFHGSRTFATEGKNYPVVRPSPRCYGNGNAKGNDGVSRGRGLGAASLGSGGHRR